MASQRPRKWRLKEGVVQKSEKPLNVQLKELKSTLGLDNKEVKAELGKSSFIRMVWQEPGSGTLRIAWNG